MKYRELLSYGASELKDGVSSPEVDARELLLHAFDMSLEQYVSRADEDADKDGEKRFFELIERRKNCEPLQYITNKAYFYGREFYVNDSVLIPRLDSETLIEYAIGLGRDMRILDICTGSGCLLLTLLKETGGSGVGTDISKEALEVAKINAKRLEVDADFEIADITYGIIREEFDLIISNPPYIKTGDISGLDTEVKDHEPILALDGGDDGLNFYRRIVLDAPKFMKSGAHIVFEIGYDQADDVKKILEESGYDEVKIIKDLSGNPRVATGIRNR